MNTHKTCTLMLLLITLLVSSCASPVRAVTVDTATPMPTLTVVPSETPTLVPTATMAKRATPTPITPAATFTSVSRPTLAPRASTPTWNGVVITAVPVVVATSPALDGDGGYYDYAAALEIVRLTNEFRAQNGKKPLAIDERLMDIARKRAREIVTNYSHSGLAAHCDCGENIVRGGMPDPLAAISSWINSDGHRTNMLHIYNKIGVGVYVEHGVAFYTQEFDF